MSTVFMSTPFRVDLSVDRTIVSSTTMAAAIAGLLQRRSPYFIGDRPELNDPLSEVITCFSRVPCSRGASAAPAAGVSATPPSVSRASARCSRAAVV